MRMRQQLLGLVAVLVSAGVAYLGTGTIVPSKFPTRHGECIAIMPPDIGDGVDVATRFGVVFGGLCVGVQTAGAANKQAEAAIQTAGAANKQAEAAKETAEAAKETVCLKEKELCLKEKELTMAAITLILAKPEDCTAADSEMARKWLSNQVLQATLEAQDSQTTRSPGSALSPQSPGTWPDVSACISKCEKEFRERCNKETASMLKDGKTMLNVGTKMRDDGKTMLKVGTKMLEDGNTMFNDVTSMLKDVTSMLKDGNTVLKGSMEDVGKTFVQTCKCFLSQQPPTSPTGAVEAGKAAEAEKEEARGQQVMDTESPEENAAVEGAAAAEGTAAAPLAAPPSKPSVPPGMPDSDTTRRI